ncbi:unnamed protein product [Soboliphyme baturini]|uniref:RT_RNaseH domain-containing protein n=1 Tax=Soboliphyme baturini TaxID=241478 RepID=A0A183J7U0_9BILA|nr:unnamed protein product [Soboliphyme baturini]
MLALVWALHEFRPYHYKRWLKVRTHHSCLRWLRYFRESKGQIAHWLERLAKMDFTVEHRPSHVPSNDDSVDA